MNLVRGVSLLDEAADLHLARLVLLLNAFCEDAGDAIEGITKLAKLDFLLRYPALLERALEAKGKSTKSVNLHDYERHSVESSMVRYRFGPWDHRYREHLNVLTATGLANVTVTGRTVNISLTDSGRRVATELGEDPAFSDYIRRARLLKSSFDIKATSLMKFIYETFPEVVSLRSNARIAP